jgi:hypothetical protein
VCANFTLNQDLKICVPRDLKYFYESKRHFYPCVEMDLKSKFIYELTRVKGIISNIYLEEIKEEKERKKRERTEGRIAACFGDSAFVRCPSVKNINLYLL